MLRRLFRSGNNNNKTTNRNADSRNQQQRTATANEQQQHQLFDELCQACKEGNVETAQRLLQAGARVNQGNGKKDGWTPLYAAIVNGHEAVVRLLLENGAVSHASWTPLGAASRYGQVAVVRLLLAKGANVNEASEGGLTPLHIASMHGREAVVRLMLEKGANVKQANKDGGTPLHFASQNGYDAVVRLLLEKGANVNQAKKNGDTPLHLASSNGHESIVRLLLENGANLEAANADGKTPLATAKQKGCTAIVKLLENKANALRRQQGQEPATDEQQRRLQQEQEMVARLFQQQLQEKKKRNKEAQRQEREKRRQQQQERRRLEQERQQAAAAAEERRRRLEQEASAAAVAAEQQAFAAIRTKIQVVIAASQMGKHIPPARITNEAYCDSIMTTTVLGEGFFGVVHKAHDSELQQSFAVKTNKVPLHLLDEEHREKVIKSFRTELTTLHEFNHPNIVSLYAYYFTEDLQGQQYLLYELAEKGSLSSFLQADFGRDRLSSFQLRLRIARDIATALQFLHKGNGNFRHCCHRDIKSSNVIIKNDMTAQLIDCGLAKSVPRKGATSATSGGSFTPEYVCPMFRSGEIDEYRLECDIYSLGLVMAELWTGRLQMQKDTSGNKIDLHKKYGRGSPPELLLNDADDALDIAVLDNTPFYAKEFVKQTVQCISENWVDRPLGDTVVPTLQKCYDDCEALTKENADVVERQNASPSAMSSAKVLCSLCREGPVRCHSAGSLGFLCLSCLLAEGRRQVVAQFTHSLSVMHKDLKQEIFRSRQDNLHLHQHTHNTLASVNDVLSSLDARLVNQIPSLFVLLPAEKADLRKKPLDWLKDKARREFHLYFVCAHSHSKVENAPLTFRVSKKWVARVAPILAASLYVIQLAAQLSPVAIDPGLGDTAIAIWDELGGLDKLGEMVQSLQEIASQDGGGLSQLSAATIHQLDKETVEPIIEMAAAQRDWLKEMVHVRSGNSPQTKWVLKQHATKDGYQPVR